MSWADEVVTPARAKHPAIQPVRCNIPWPVGHECFGQGFSHARTLCGVVVDEHDRLQTEVQFLDQFKDVLRLVTPVNPPSNEIMRTQDHFGMLCDSLHGDVVFVLADDH